MSRTLKYFLVWVALMVLLALTVAAWEFHLGVWAAVAIAVTKAALVVAFFMHLAEEPLETRFMALAVSFWLILLFGLTFCDYLTRAG